MLDSESYVMLLFLAMSVCVTSGLMLTLQSHVVRSNAVLTAFSVARILAKNGPINGRSGAENFQHSVAQQVLL
jgi:hypothetical protein